MFKMHVTSVTKQSNKLDEAEKANSRWVEVNAALREENAKLKSDISHLERAYEQVDSMYEQIKQDSVDSDDI